VMRLVRSRRGRNNQKATSATATTKSPAPRNNSFLLPVSELSAGSLTTFVGATAVSVTALVWTTIGPAVTALVGGTGGTFVSGKISVAGGGGDLISTSGM